MTSHGAARPRRLDAAAPSRACGSSGPSTGHSVSRTSPRKWIGRRIGDADGHRVGVRLVGRGEQHRPGRRGRGGRPRPQAQPRAQHRTQARGAPASSRRAPSADRAPRRRHVGTHRRRTGVRVGRGRARHGHWGRLSWTKPGCAGASQRPQDGDQRVAGLLGRDDLVDAAAPGGEVDVHRVARGSRRPAPRGGRARPRLATEDDVGRALGAHDRELGVGPGEHRVGTEAARVHHDVGATERLAQHDRDARHGRGGERVQQLGALADHAAVLLCGAGQEAGHVDGDDQRDAERVAEPHEPGALLAGGQVEHAGQPLGLVGDDADGAAVDAGEPDRRGCGPSAPGPRGTGRRRRRRG